MKKNLKSIIVLAVILLALVSVVVFLTMSGKDTEDGTASSDLPVSSSSYDPITIIHSQYDIIGEITIINKEDEYTLIPKESDASDTSAASSSSEISFTIKGYEDYTLNQPGIDQLVASLTDIEASRELEDPMDLSEYGLADGGMSKVTVKYTDGASDEYIIGNETANDSGCYLLKNDKVYIVPFIPSTAVGSSLSFIDTQVFSITPDESTGSSGDTSVVLDRIELTGESFKEPVIIEYDEDSINKDIITSPIQADANYQKIQDITSLLKSLKASSAVKVKCIDADLAEYGLDSPYLTAVFTAGEESHTLNISKPDEENKCYITADNIDIIYSLEKDTLSVLIDSKLSSLRSELILIPYIQTVEKITISTSDNSFIFNTQRQKDEEKSTDETPVYTYSVKLGENDIDYDNTYKPFYQKLISLPVLLDETDVTEHGGLVLSIKYDYFDKKDSDEIKIFEIIGKERYYIEKNGKYHGIMRKSTAEEFSAYVSSISEA